MGRVLLGGSCTCDMFVIQETLEAMCGISELIIIDDVDHAVLP